MASYKELHLRRGDLALSVAPGLGGAITRFRHGDLDLLRPWDGSDNVRLTGCFVLAPYSNRIGNGQFAFDGQTHRLRRNAPEFELPLHGVAWKRAWAPTAMDSTSLTLEVQHRAQGTNAQDWPFDFQLTHRLRLDADGLGLRLVLTNTGQVPMPAGLGWHPYFLRHDAVEMAFDASSVWLADDQQLPSQQVKVPAEWDFSTLRPVGEPGLDNCFAGWGGQARLRWPNRNLDLRLSSEAPLRHLVVFTPPAERGILALEPVSHANNALNLPHPAAHGMLTLRPGESITATCRMDVRAG
ncbi:aldose 1-epimerase [Stutzerimonas urumqiensis]|uniref:aldose 1-epimerase n=1 Tax=Stutzerimonas urumqiensis TaxID=638269 RepID=UPI003BAC2925